MTIVLSPQTHAHSHRRCALGRVDWTLFSTVRRPNTAPVRLCIEAILCAEGSLREWY